MASAAVFALDVIVLIALCAFAFRYYADFRTNYVVTFVVLYTWFLSFAIVLVLPIDVSAVRAPPRSIHLASCADLTLGLLHELPP